MEREYKVEENGNGLFVTITRLSDGLSCFLQDEEALTFSHEYDNVPESTKDAICEQYDDLMS